MKKIIPTLILSVTLVLTSFSQPLPKKAYFRMEGKINNESILILNLVKVNDSLYTDYPFQEGMYTPYSGKISTDGSFTLKSFYNEKGDVIRGKFTDRSNVTGTIEMKSEGKKQPLRLSEKYPAGSLPLSVYYQSAFRPLVTKPGSPRGSIEQCVIVPGESSNPLTSDTLKKIILKMFSRRDFAKTDPAWVLNSLQQIYFEDYISTNEDLYKDIPDSHMLDWQFLKLMHIIYNDDDFLTFYVQTYAFTGGAHGLQTEEYSVVYTKTGTLLKASDIFKPDYEAGVTLLLTQKLKSSNNLNGDQKLSENGWFTDEIKPNENFYVTPGGIGFHYNPYEIAPYSSGSTDIFLTFGELGPFLETSSVISGLIR